eukprot:GHUV01056502.1.p1 GENE.GHUV01056502.1~~GHUV01056502.1.p1  ORF type:complete len:150 (+),score=12.37 GHUV01056502.1:43-450(+)
MEIVPTHLSQNRLLHGLADANPVFCHCKSIPSVASDPSSKQVSVPEGLTEVLTAGTSLTTGAVYRSRGLHPLQRLNCAGNSSSMRCPATEVNCISHCCPLIVYPNSHMGLYWDLSGHEREAGAWAGSWLANDNPS